MILKQTLESLGIPWNPPNSIELELELWHQFQDWNLNWGSIPIPKFAYGIGIGIDGIVPMTDKSYTLPTEVVDGSNESLYYPDEGLGPYLKTGSLL